MRDPEQSLVEYHSKAACPVQLTPPAARTRFQGVGLLRTRRVCSYFVRVVRASSSKCHTRIIVCGVGCDGRPNGAP